MSGQKDEAVGRVKEAAGVLVDDDDLKREGKIDQAAGKVKKTADKAERKVEEIVDDVKKKLDN